MERGRRPEALPCCADRQTLILEAQGTRQGRTCHKASKVTRLTPSSSTGEVIIPNGERVLHVPVRAGRFPVALEMTNMVVPEPSIKTSHQLSVTPGTLVLSAVQLKIHHSEQDRHNTRIMGSFTRFGLDIADPRQPTRGRAVGPGTIAQGQEQNKATRCTVRADPICVPCRNHRAPLFIFIEHEEARESNTLGRACLNLRRRNYASGEGELPDPAAWP